MKKEFESLYRKDQYHVRRWAVKYTDEEFAVINKNLQKRLELLIKHKKEELSGRECFIAAMIYHHGFTVACAKKAVAYAKKAVNKGYLRGKWLVASATDRLCQLQGKAQKFGTQIIETKTGKVRMYKVDPKTTDEERKAYGLPSLQSLKDRLR